MKTKKLIATLLIASAGVTLIAPIGTFALENKTILSEIQSNESDIVSIPDKNFKTLLNNALGQPADSEIKKSDLETITILDTTRLMPQYAGDPITNIEGIEYCKNLEELGLNSNKISDLSPLSELTNLTYLSMQSNKITDLTPLANLVNLRNVDLEWNQISDITPLTNITNLSTLRLSNNKITDIPNLENMKSLYMLLLNNNSLNSLTPITTAPKLEQLQLDSIGISDLTPLENMKTLTSLTYQCNEVSDLTPLSNLTNLRILSVFGNNINDVTPLKDLINLESLNISRNEIIDLSQLENLTKLYFLFAEENKIEDIEVLDNMPELVVVHLNNNRILNLSPLNNLTNLTTLIIENQKIENSIESTGRFATTTDIAIGVDGTPIKPKNISENGIIKDNKLLWRNINSDTICDYSYDTTIKIGNISTRFTANATSEIKYNKGKSPVIHGADNIEIKKGSEFNPMEGVYYTDEDEAPNSKIHVIGEVDTNIEGNYTLIYTVTDSWGNNATFYREVFVV